MRLYQEYRESKKVQGVTEATLYEIALRLRYFERLVGKFNSKQTAQNSIDKLILERGQEVKRSTLNKNIRNLRTFINWCRENRYLNGNLKIKELKEDNRPVRSLNDIQIKKLLAAANVYPSIKMRILLPLCTGLRRGDIKSLKISDIDFINNCITTTSRKTRKSMGFRPVPASVMKELKIYADGLNSEQIRFFNKNFNHKRWKKYVQMHD